jgi:hypothetical protein
MSLLQSLADLALFSGGHILEAVERSGIIFAVFARLPQGLLQVFDDPRSYTAPLKTSDGILSKLWIERYPPMTPMPGLKALSIDPGTETQLPLEDFDLLIFAFFVLATSTAGGSLLCRIVRRIQ